MSSMWTADIHSATSGNCLMTGDSLGSYYRAGRNFWRLSFIKPIEFQSGDLARQRKKKKAVILYFQSHPLLPAARAACTYLSQISDHCTDWLSAKQAKRDVDSIFLWWKTGEWESLCCGYLFLCSVHCSALTSWILASGSITWTTK